MYEETSHEAPLAPDGSHGDDDFARLIATLIRRSNFIVQALTGDPITIYGDGMQTRSFCYVDDLIEGFLPLMGTDKSVAGPINLGNPIDFSMLELAFPSDIEMLKACAAVPAIRDERESAVRFEPDRLACPLI